MNGARKFKRRKVVVSYRILLQLAAFCIFVLLASIGTLYVSADSVLGLLADPDFSPMMPRSESGYYQQVAELRAYLHWVFFGVAGAASVGSWVGLAFMVNRIAGPVYRIQKTLEAPLEPGKDVKILLRKGDFFGELSKAIESFINKTK